MKNIPVFDISLKFKDKKYLFDAIKKNQFTSGIYVKLLEKEFSNFIGCKYGISTTSGTTALHLACIVAGIKKNDEVLVSASTNMASAFAIIYCGGIPVPIDVDLSNWQINPEEIEKKITKKTKAIMVVHLFGQTSNMNKIVKLAKRYGLKIIEDCAESHGIECANKKVGTFGDISAFSFYFNKTITSGEGGMVLTNSKKIATKIESLKNLCYGKKKRFMHNNIGYNYRMANLNAALALGQLRNIKSIIKKKKKIYSQYYKNLCKLNFIKIPKIEKWETNYIMWLFNICVDEKKINRDYLMKKLDKNFNIETRTSFIPINFQKIFIKKYKSIRKNSCKNANFIMRNGLYLPSGNNLTMKKINYVCEAIKKIYNEKK